MSSSVSISSRYQYYRHRNNNSKTKYYYYYGFLVRGYLTKLVGQVLDLVVLPSLPAALDAGGDVDDADDVDLSTRRKKKEDEDSTACCCTTPLMMMTTTSTGGEEVGARQQQKGGGVSSSYKTCLICYEDFEQWDDDHSGETEAEHRQRRQLLMMSASSSIEDDDDRRQIEAPSSSTTCSAPPSAATSHHRSSLSCCCDHDFCNDCLKAYCRHMISIRKIPIPCPAFANSGCRQFLKPNDVRTALLLSRCSSSVAAQDDDDDDVVVAASSGGHYDAAEVASSSAIGRRSSSSSSLVLSRQLSGDGSKNASAESRISTSLPPLSGGRGLVGTTQTATESSFRRSASSPSSSSYTSDWNKYVRLQKLHDDPSLVACPRCDEPVGPIPTTRKTSSLGTNRKFFYVASSSSSSSSFSGKTVDGKYGSMSNIDSGDDSIKGEEQEYTTETLTTTNDEDDENERQRRRVCPSCRHEFCSVHGDGHVGMTCSEHLRTEESKRIRETERVLREWTQPCSHCGVAIFKASGCDHVVCPACHDDMCFRCGTHVHLTGKVIRNCTKCSSSYVDHRYNRQYRLRLCLCLPLMLPGWILYSTITGAIAIVTGCFCCCFMCGSATAPASSAARAAARDDDEDDEDDDDDYDGRYNIKMDPRPTVNNKAKYAPLLGIRRVLGMVFLPFVAFLRDFGIDCGCMDALVVNSSEMATTEATAPAAAAATAARAEMPTMSLVDDYDGGTCSFGSSFGTNSFSTGRDRIQNDNNNIGGGGAGDDLSVVSGGSDGCQRTAKRCFGCRRKSSGSREGGGTRARTIVAATQRNGGDDAV